MLARAFTTRQGKPEGDMQANAPIWLGRAASQRAGRPVPRSQISAPLALLSTSNVLLNNAQAIPGAPAIEDLTGSSTHSDDSDASSGHRTAGSLTDASSVDENSSPATPVDPEPNHLSCYFKPAVDTTSVSPDSTPRLSRQASFDAPRLPQRVPSHSKKAHERLHRKNSLRRSASAQCMLSPPPSRGREIRHTTDMFSPAIASTPAFVEAPKEPPFGRELTQLDEAAEEFGQVARDAEAEADFATILSRGLGRYAASDYTSEIQDLVFATFYEDEPAFGGWI